MQLRSSAGSIQKLGANRYKVVVTYGFDARTGKQHRKCKTIRGSRREAELIKAQMMLSDEPSDVTLGEYTQIYLDDAKLRVRDYTFTGYERAAKKIFDSTLQYVKLSALNERTVRLWLDEQQTIGGKETAYKILRQVLRHARRAHYVPYVVTDSIDCPKPKERPKDTIAAEEIHNYLAAVAGTEIEAGVIISLAVGLRRSEVCALSWEDITEDGRVSVTKSLHETKGGGLKFEDTKTKKSNRVVYLPEWALKRINEIRRTSSGEWVCMYDGELIHPDYFSNLWRRYCKKKSLRPIQLKNLRHSCGTILVREAQLPISDVSQLLGHTSTRTTENFYVQPSEVSAKRTAKAWDTLGI